MTLLEAHREHLHGSGLRDATIEAAGIYSVEDAAEAARILNWDGHDGPAPAIAFPIRSHDGSLCATVLRPDEPVRRKDGRTPKYEWAKSTSGRLYFPPEPIVDAAAWSDSAVPLVFTEGVKKALSCAQTGMPAIGASGVSMWHDSQASRGGHPRRLHPDLAGIPLKGRRLFIAFDGGDTTENPLVILEEARLCRMLLDAGADVLLLRFPFKPGGPKVGVDDFLVTWSEAERLAALEKLRAEALPGDPLARAAAVRKAPRDDRHALAQELLKDVSFVAALYAGGGAIVDVVQSELYAAAHVSKKTLSEGTASFRRMLAPQRRDGDEQDASRQKIPYESTPEGIIWHKETRDGVVPVPLCNFTARIVSDVTEDDGVEARRAFSMEGSLHGRSCRFDVLASRYRGLDWPVEYLGAGAVISPGYGAREHLPAAVQLLSGEIPPRTVYGHTGWREIDSKEWAYLHAGGAIGTVGAVADIEIALPVGIRLYELPSPPVGSDLTTAVRASLRILDLAPDRLTVPLYSAIWRAPLGAADFGLHFSGQTGVFKSELTALAQRHYGPRMDARNLPGNWLSTGNALEMLASRVADALFTVDDFCPAGSPHDVQRMHAAADRLFRGAGNGSSRQRMSADLSLRPPRPPRGLIVSTGEETPAGQSLRGRILCLEVGPGDVEIAKLSRCQTDAGAGLYAAALSGYVQWLAEHHAEIWAGTGAKLLELRQRATTEGQHHRTPDIVANLSLGLDTFASFAVQVGALEFSEAERLRARAWSAFGEAAMAQRGPQDDAEPARRFLTLLTSAIASGRAHLAGPDGGAPNNPSALGWRRFADAEAWAALGRCVGWTEGEDLFLDRDAALSAANEVGNGAGGPILISAGTLAKRLKDQGFLRTVDGKRQRLTIRRTLAGSIRDVLHLSLESVAASPLSSNPPPSKPSKTTIANSTERPVGTVWTVQNGEGGPPREDLSAPFAGGEDL